MTRIGADFKTPLLEANYFTIRSNATASASVYSGYGPRPTGYAMAGKAFLGSADTLKGTWISWAIFAVVVMML